jgi:hypothetical protein
MPGFAADSLGRRIVVLANWNELREGHFLHLRDPLPNPIRVDVVFVSGRIVHTIQDLFEIEPGIRV